MFRTLALPLAAALLSTTAIAQSQSASTPEGALLQVNPDLAYAPGSLTSEQLETSTRDLFAQQSMNVFRRFPREQTEEMVNFYVNALGLRSLQPIQLTSTQQMILTGVGSGQIKLSAGQPGGRSYDLSGGVAGGTGIRFLALTYPDADMVRDRFTAAGFAAPEFTRQQDGSMVALLQDPGGMTVRVTVRHGAQDGSNDGVGVGIAVSDLATSRAYYREFVGLDELTPVTDMSLGLTLYPYRHAETTLYLYEVGEGLPADTGSAGIQYVVRDAAMVDARAAHREVAVQTPLNMLPGFGLITVWLYDPDGVTNYFAQVGQRRASGASPVPQGQAGSTPAPAPSASAPDLTVLPPVPDDYRPALTSWGEPDLRGTWPIDHLNGLPLQRTDANGDRHFLTDEEFAERTERIERLAGRYDNEESSDAIGQGHWVEMGEASRRTSLMVEPQNGQLPAMTAEGERRRALMRSSWARGQDFDWVTDFDSWDRCITRGLPASMMPMMYNNGLRVFQAPGLVAIQMEMIHEVRLIPTDGSSHPSPMIQNWLGDSRGHWEDANTLVVETTNFRPGASATNIVTSGSPPENNTPMSTAARLVERFTMTGPDSIVYESHYEDPVVFTAPWGTRLDWVRDDDYEFFEYACHEGNVQLRNYITASRAERERTAAEGTD